MSLVSCPDEAKASNWRLSESLHIQSVFRQHTVQEQRFVLLPEAMRKTKLSLDKTCHTSQELKCRKWCATVGENYKDFPFLKAQKGSAWNRHQEPSLYFCSYRRENNSYVYIVIKAKTFLKNLQFPVCLLKNKQKKNRSAPTLWTKLTELDASFRKSHKIIKWCWRQWLA